MKTFKELQKIISLELLQKLQMFQSDEAEVLIEHILQANQVFVVGDGGRMQHIAKAINVTLKSAGVNVKQGYGSGSLLIVISSTGDESGMITKAQNALSSGCTVLVLSPNTESTLAEISHAHVEIPTILVAKGTDESIQPGTALTEQSVLVYFDIVSIEIRRALG